jgi:hypothetical protein
MDTKKAEADPFAWITPETAARLTKPLKFSIMEKAEARNAEEILDKMKIVKYRDLFIKAMESYASLREAQAVEKFKKELNDKLVQWIKESYRITNDGGPSLAGESSMFDEMSNEEIEAQAKGFKEVRLEFGLIQPPDHENR